MMETVSIRSAPLPYCRPLVWTAALFAVVCALAWLAIKYAYGNDRISAIWASDAVILSCLLRTQRSEWWQYILIGFLGNALANYLNVHVAPTALAVSFLSVLSAFVAASLLNWTGQGVDLTRRNGLIKFLIAAGLCGPAVSATLAAPYIQMRIGGALFSIWRGWFLEHAMGFIVITPPLLMVTFNDLRESFQAKDRMGLLATLSIVAVTTTVIFWQTAFPLFFLIFPTLILASLRGGFVGASLAALLTAIISVSLTLAHHGPLTLIENNFGLQILILQIFLATGFLSSIPIAVALTEIQKFKQEMTIARQDLTEQNRLLQLAEQTARLGHWRHDLETSKVFWSDETYRIHGREKSTYVPTPETVTESYHPEDQEKIVRASDHAIARQDGTNVVLRLVLPNDEIRYIETLTRCEFDEDGKPRILFGVSHDITASKRTEYALIEALDEAKRANRAKSDFLASMSHELRTPLNAVIGFSELLLHHPREHLTELQTEYLEYILRSGNQLLQLVKDVLDLSTIEAGRLHVSLQPVDLTELMEELEATLAALARNRGIKFEPISLPKTMPPVRADRGRLLQVLINLGTNAIKYNKPDGTLTISAVRTSDGHIRISVSDNGKGIPLNRQNELFQPFSRLGSENSSIEGTGIGLSICKQLIELMGGVIGFTSEPNIGSTFWIELTET